MLRRSPGYYALLTVVCIHFALAYTRDLPVYDPWYRLVAGSVAGPAQSRILIPLLFRWSLTVKPYVALSHRVPSPYNDPLNLLMVIVVAISIFVAAEAVRVGARSLGIAERLCTLAAFSVPVMGYFNYILVPEVRTQTLYDVPQVAFFAVCFTALLTRRYVLFVVCFAVATLNRESTCFLIPVAGLLALHGKGGRLRDERWRIAAGMTLLCAIWLPLRYFTFHFFPGVRLVDYPWQRNAKLLVNPLHWPTYMSVFAFLWIPWLVYFRRIGHAGLQWCAVLFPFWLALMFVVGDPLEIRLHGEWTAYFALCLALIVADLTGQRAHRVTEQ